MVKFFLGFAVVGWIDILAVPRFFSLFISTNK